jgi:WD40 repeat protein
VPDGKTLALTSGKSLQLRNADTGELIREIPGRGTTMFSPDGTRVVLHDGFLHTISLWDTTNGRMLRSFEVPSESIEISADWSRLVVVGDGTTTVWELASGKLLATLIANEDGDWVAFTSEGYFDGSANAAGLFSIVRGFEFVARERVEKALRRPDLLREKLAGDRDGRVEAAARTIAFD